MVETVRRQLGSAEPGPAAGVDADLRPEGRTGPLVRTLASYREYYARWSEAWEAQALLRARPIAGDADLGRRFIELIDPIRYPDDGLTPAPSPRSAGSRRGWTPSGCPAARTGPRTPSSASAGSPTSSGRCSCCSCSTPATSRSCAPPATLDGLREAAEADLITHDDAEELAAGWMMATRARNAIMLVRGKPGDQLPRSGRELAAVAAALGYPPDGDPGVFLDDYRRATRRARAVVERVFYGW